MEETRRLLRRHETEPGPPGEQTHYAVAWNVLFGAMEPRLAAFIDMARESGAPPARLDQLEAEIVALTNGLRDRVNQVYALGQGALPRRDSGPRTWATFRAADVA